MKLKSTLLRRVTAFSVGMALTLPISAGNAIAQEDESGSSSDETLEEVVVTGSRIKRTNLTSSSPVTQVDADEFLYNGITRVEDLLNDLPQVFATQTAGQSNGATGTATVDLRGLGTVRTLVLMNGRRLPSGSPAAGGIAADLNQVPAGLIERVEILTGGASAAYGSDAVAGVVNFITKDNFEGLELNYQHSFFQHDNDSVIADIVRNTGFELPDSSESDGNADDISVLLGVNTADGRGNISAFASYRDIEAVTQSERDYSACALGGGPDAFTCGGSSTIPRGRFTDLGALTGVGPGSFDYVVDGNQFVPRAGHPDRLYNFAPLNFYQRPDKRRTLGAFGHYKLNEKAELYTELSFMDNRSVAQIAPSGAFFVTDTLNCGNPLMSAQQFQVICGDYGLTTADSQTVFVGRRNVEGGPRQDDLRHTSYRNVFGLRGDINENWSYDVFANFAKVSYIQTYRNDLSSIRIARALDVVPDPSDPTQAVCQSVLDGTDPDCVPWNIFQTGGVTQEAIDYLTLPLYGRGDTRQVQISGYVTGDLGYTLPNAHHSIKTVLGYEFREEGLVFEPDNGFSSGDGAGQGGPIQGVEGKFDVDELFAEASIPLLEGSDIAERIALDLGYRRSEYSTDKKTNTYKVAAEWVVDSNLTFRSSVQRAVRAGNLRELFRPNVLGLFDMSEDPCAGAAPTRSLAECARTGVTASQYGTIADSPAGQYNEITGGNTSLDPEESDTISLGVILNPSFLPDLTVSIDYFDIDVQDAIDSINSEFILTQCLDTGDSLYCDLISRGPTTGTLWIGNDHILSTDINIGFIKTSGFDIVGDYNAGNFHFSVVGTLLKKWDEQEVPGSPIIDCIGSWGSSCGTPTPKWRHSFRTTWTSPWNMTVSAAWRHIGGVDDLGANEAHFSSQDYIDVATLWNVAEDINVRFGINNLLDKDPPLTSDAGPSIFGNGNTFPGVYDALGRYIFAGVTLRY